MKYLILFSMLFIGLTVSAQEPMNIDFQNSAQNRWLNKEILTKNVLDNMEDQVNWIPFTGGAISLVDSRTDSKAAESKKNHVEAGISGKKYHTGQKSLMIRFPSKIEVPGPKSGRGWGNAGVWYMVQNEDWTKFNRISVWIYPDNPGVYQNWLELRVFNDGNEKLPALFGQEGESIFNLKNHAWNQ